MLSHSLLVTSVDTGDSFSKQSDAKITCDRPVEDDTLTTASYLNSICLPFPPLRP